MKFPLESVIMEIALLRRLAIPDPSNGNYRLLKQTCRVVA
jgi:hypothetical protein